MFYKNILWFLAFVLVISFGLTFAGCDSSETDSNELAIQITSPEDGSELLINLVKIEGIVSDSEAIVTINEIESIVSQDGAFYSLIELMPGENTVEALATYGTQTTLFSINVDFVPPLVVNLIREIVNWDLDFAKNPIKVKGMVSNPLALVTINGTPVQVLEDGSFSSNYQLKQLDNDIEAVAMLGEQKDSWLIGLYLTPEGEVLTPPGFGSGAHWYEPMLRYEKNIEIIVGETKSVDIFLDSGKYIPFQYPHEIYYEIENPSLSAGNLIIMTESQRFTAYANTTYHSTIMIKSTNEVIPGEYEVRMIQHGLGYAGHLININVIP